MINGIGTTDDTALLCNTNYRPLNSGVVFSGGNWYAPDNTRVGDIVSNDVPGFRRNRNLGVLRLIRNASSNPAEGIYHSEIQDNTNIVHILYVGLYNNGGGGSFYVDFMFTCYNTVVLLKPLC